MKKTLTTCISLMVILSAVYVSIYAADDGACKAQDCVTAQSSCQDVDGQCKNKVVPVIQEMCFSSDCEYDGPADKPCATIFFCVAEVGGPCVGTSNTAPQYISNCKNK